MGAVLANGLGGPIISSLHKCARINVCGFKSPSWGNFLRQPEKTDTNYIINIFPMLLDIVIIVFNDSTLFCNIRKTINSLL